MEKHKKIGIVIEVAVVTGILVTVTSFLHSLQSIPFIYNYYGLIFAIMFLYVPVVVGHRRGRKIDFLDRSASAYLKSIITFLITSVIVFPLFILAAHFWERMVYNAGMSGFKILPDLWKILAFQLIMVALPEEFFFRGYVQSVLNLAFPPKWRLLSANLGWGWIVTAVVFAAAHSFITFQWWHFAIFFPALLFGYLRERTGSITAPILFHAASNIVMAWINQAVPTHG